MKAIYLIVVTSVFILLSSCKDEDVITSSGLTGEESSVVVNLQLNIPKAATVKNGATPRSSSPNDFFRVSIDDSSPSEIETRTGGTTKLYNLWIFQFNANGAINGIPHKVSDEVTAINDLVTIEVSLVVSENQTLYLIALGPKLSADFSQIKTLSDLKKWEFDYTTSEGGLVQSKITQDEEIPFAGIVSGVKVLEIDGGKRGLVEFNTPDGFSGNIPIRRLMSHIVLKYKFEVADYSLEGLKMINASGVVRLENPSKNSDTDSYITLAPYISGPDADGFMTATWYIPQNKQGDVPTILTETDRYYKKSGTTAFGFAPPLGCNIEAWANSKSNLDEYAIYQMYIGLNNTANFDVLANSIYNLRTTINTDLNAIPKDERIRSYRADQSIYLAASAVKKSGYGTISSPTGASYDFDAHFCTRPITVNTKGTTVTVGIYNDLGCTDLADPSTSWLKVSSSKNFTAAYHNSSEPLTTSLETQTFLPTQLKFYLYADEFIFDEKGEIATTSKKRSLYVKVHTVTKGGTNNIIRSSGVFTMDQRQGIYAGNFGGELKNGAYTHGLFASMINESERKYDIDQAITSPAPYYAYERIILPPAYRGSFENGRLATRTLAENPDGLVMNTSLSTIVAPRRLANGNIDIYQYRDYNSFSARFCYDRNRDEDGDGVISDAEMKWYIPSSKQGSGYYVTYPVSGVNNMGLPKSFLTTHAPKTYNLQVFYNDSFQNHSRTSSGYITMCVREVPKEKFSVQTSPAAYVYTDEKNTAYAAINAQNMVRNVVDRTTATNFYQTNMPLYDYTPNGELAEPILDPISGDTVRTKRIIRHSPNSSNEKLNQNNNVSGGFIISPEDVPDQGISGNLNMDWATANGYLATANTTEYQIGAQATNRGCSRYKGRNNTDPEDTWRIPTRKEWALILVFETSFLETSASTGFKEFGKSDSPFNLTYRYWTATEDTFVGRGYYVSSFDNDKVANLIHSYGLKTSTPSYRLRCIKDLPPTP